MAATTGRADGVRVADRDGARYVTLCRPPVNALSLREYAALEHAFTIAAGVPGAPRVVVLRAEGRTWCAGQDTREFAALPGGAARAAYLRRAAQAVAAAARCPVPVVAAVHAPAIGAGGLLVAAADVVLCADGAWLAFPELALGVQMGAALLRDFLPAPLVRYALATGARLDAARLHAAGAVAEVLPPPELAARTAAVVAGLLGLPDTALRWLREPATGEARARACEEEAARAAEMLAAGPDA